MRAASRACSAAKARRFLVVVLRRYSWAMKSATCMLSRNVVRWARRVLARGKMGWFGEVEVIRNAGRVFARSGT